MSIKTWIIVMLLLSVLLTEPVGRFWLDPEPPAQTETRMQDSGSTGAMSLCCKMGWVCCR